MNSIEFLRKLTGLMSELSNEDMLLPFKVNDKLVNDVFFSVNFKNGERYFNLLVNNDQR